MDASKLNMSQFYETLNKSLPLSTKEFSIIAKENPGLVNLVKTGKAAPIPVRVLPNGMYEPFGDGATRLIINKALGIKKIPIEIIE